MTANELFKTLSATLGKVQVQELAAQAEAGQLKMHDLLSLSFQKEHPSVAFRAAWVLEEVVYTFPDSFVPYLPEFIERLPEQQNLSCQRHFSKILMRCTDPKTGISFRTAWQAIPDREQVVETIFDWLISPRTPVAVQVNCLDVLLHLQAEFDWIKEELKAQVEYLLRDGSAAMQSRGRKVLKKVSRKKP